VAALIKSSTGLDTEIVEGARGEFTVWVDGKRVAQKTADGFPEDQQALSAVKQAVGER
jgi:hypothetical protein